MNLIPITRETLRLEENEEFKIKFHTNVFSNKKFRFTNKFLEEFYQNRWYESDKDVLYGLITEKINIVKLPFKPKEGEDYYFVDVSTGYVCRTTYGVGYRHDVVRIREALRVSSGNCYRTEEEAEKHVNEWMSKIYGENWKELLK